tara:strand:+ start:115 stop:534 length:420 start_codon:yes stop_codon:yes gene_type:complete
MKRYFLVFLLIFISCTWYLPYFDESYLDDYGTALRNLKVPEEDINKFLDEARSTCLDSYESITTYVFDDEAGFLEVQSIQAASYSSARYAGADPTQAYDLYLAFFNMCGLDDYIEAGCPECRFSTDLWILETDYQSGNW